MPPVQVVVDDQQVLARLRGRVPAGAVTADRPAPVRVRAGSAGLRRRPPDENGGLLHPVPVALREPRSAHRLGSGVRREVPSGATVGFGRVPVRSPDARADRGCRRHRHSVRPPIRKEPEEHRGRTSPGHPDSPKLPVHRRRRTSTNHRHGSDQGPRPPAWRTPRRGQRPGAWPSPPDRGAAPTIAARHPHRAERRAGHRRRIGSAGMSPPKTVNRTERREPMWALEPTATAAYRRWMFGTYSADSTVRPQLPKNESVIVKSSCSGAPVTTSENGSDRARQAEQGQVRRRPPEWCPVRQPRRHPQCVQGLLADLGPTPAARTAMPCAPPAHRRMRAGRSASAVRDHRRGVVDDRQRDGRDRQPGPPSAEATTQRTRRNHDARGGTDACAVVRGSR